MWPSVIHLTTVHQFRLPDALVARLPPPEAEGQRFIDVRVHCAWDGILVVDTTGDCVGIYARRQVEAPPILLPFEPSQIETLPADVQAKVSARLAR